MSDKKYPIGGYAPGFYTRTCCICKNEFQGDKRAVQCEPCATKAPHPSESPGVNIKEGQLWARYSSIFHTTDGMYLMDFAGFRNALNEAIEFFRKESAGASAVWVKGQYDKLYDQVTSGKRTVCYVDYRWDWEDRSKVLRDICTIHPITMEFGARGIGYGSVRFMEGDHKENFIQLCEKMNVEWLHETESPSLSPDQSYQERVGEFMIACFGKDIPYDITERNHRFLEEALELIQSTGCTDSEAHQLVDYVFNRPIGEKHQEVGGVMVTLAALCTACNIDMNIAGETELKRVWSKIDAIRIKQANKPKHSPLPSPDQSGKEDAVAFAKYYITARREYIERAAEEGKESYAEALKKDPGYFYDIYQSKNK